MTLKEQIHDTPWWQLKMRASLRRDLRQLGRKILIRRMERHAAEVTRKERFRRLHNIEDLANIAMGDDRIWLSAEDFSLLAAHIKPAPWEKSNG